MIPPDTYDSYPEDVCVLKDGPDFQEDLQPTAGSREGRAACMGTLRRDSQCPRLPEGPLAWTMTAPHWGWAPTAVHYDTIQPEPFLLSVSRPSEHMALACLVHAKIEWPFWPTKFNS